MSDLDQELYQAVLCGDTEQAARLLADGADVNAVNVSGYTPLHAAVIYNRPNLITMLVDHHADVNSTGNVGFTPLYRCLIEINGHTPRMHSYNHGDGDKIPNVLALLDAGADPNIGKCIGQALFDYCTKHDNKFKDKHDKDKQNPGALETLLPMLQKNGYDVNRADDIGRTLLHYACAFDEVGAGPHIRLLLRAGADPNVSDVNGRTPLHTYLSCRAPNTTTLNAFKQAGADVNSRDNAGRTPLHWLCALHVRSDYYKSRTVRWLLDDAGAELLEDNFGDTPLSAHIATQLTHDYDNYADYLTSGADLDDPDHADDAIYALLVQRLTPAQAASHQPPVTQPPLNIDFDLTGFIECGLDRLLHTVSDYANPHLNPKIADIRNHEFQQRLANALPRNHGAADEKGRTLLHRAAASKHAGCAPLALLQAAGADIEQPDYNGMTPLMTAVAAVNTPAVQWLLNAGADVHARDIEGRTVLHHCVQLPHGISDKQNISDMITLLTAAGARLDACTDVGQTPLHNDPRTRNSFARNNLTALLSQSNSKDSKVLRTEDSFGCSPIQVPLHSEFHEIDQWNEKLKSVLDNVADPNSPCDAHGQPPLHNCVIHACRHVMQPKLVETLLSAGADPMHLDRYGVSALMRAVSTRSESAPELVQTLLAAGADPDTGKSLIADMYRPFPACGDARRPRPYNLMRSTARRQILETLLVAGLDPNKPAPDTRDTLLHQLCSVGAPLRDIMLAVRFNASLNATNHAGDTPLLTYCRRLWHSETDADSPAASIGTLKTLLDAGCDATLANLHGITPIQAIHESHPDDKISRALSDLLLEHGAEPPQTGRTRTKRPEAPDVTGRNVACA